MIINYGLDCSCSWGKTTSGHHNISSHMARGKGNGCHQKGRGHWMGLQYMEQLLRGVTCPGRGVRQTDHPSSWLWCLLTHPHTNIHTHNTPRHRYGKKGSQQMVRCTLPLEYSMQCAKKNDSDQATCPVERLQHSLYCCKEERERGVGVKPNWMWQGRVQSFRGLVRKEKE